MHTLSGMQRLNPLKPQNQAIPSPVPGYRVERLLGRGAMARVYLATEENSGRRLALKVLDSGYGEVEEVSLRFLHEGRLLARLKHRNLVTLYDVGLVGGIHYMSTEFLEGGDLTRRLGKPVAPGAALAWVEAIARGLARVHAEGIVHRDIKPGNILFRRDGTPVLTDFGVAKDLANEAQLTADGTIIGSLAYLSPEQADGQTPTPCTDLYALGLILYELLTGTSARPDLPILGSGNFRQSLEAALAAVHRPLPRLPAGLAAVQPLLDRMTAPEAGERMQSGEDVVEAITALRQTAATRAARTPAPAGPQGTRNALYWDLYRDHMIDALEVPALAPGLTRLDRLLATRAPERAGVERLLGAEPTAREGLLAVAGSALCAGGRAVLDVGDALDVLGVAAARDLAAATTLGSLKTPGEPALRQRFEQTWAHGCRVAALGWLLASLTGAAEPGRALVAGLLHRAGRLVLLSRAEHYPGHLGSEEQVQQALERLGVAVTATVLDKWAFTAPFAAAVLEVEDWQRETGSAADLADVVLLARLMALYWEHEFDALPQSDDIPARRRLEGCAGRRLGLEVLSENQAELKALALTLEALRH